MNKNNLHGSADMFLYKATIDLNSGIYLLEAFNANKIEIDIEKIYFELQQSAEKLLKSILCRKNIQFPKTHDIERLIEICQISNIILVEDIDTLIELSDYAVDGRYSIIHDDINEAEKYIVIINKLIVLLKANI
jgi:HEPN domain-containing protein